MAQNRGAFSEVRTHGAGPAHLTPWRDYSEMRCQMDELFNRALGYTPLARMFTGDTQLLDPDVDIYEIDDVLLVIVALPGFAPDMTDVELCGDTVTIQGHRTSFVDSEKAVAHRLGWSTGVNHVHTAINMPCAIDHDRASGTLIDGALKLKLHKTDRTSPDTVKIQICGASTIEAPR